MEELDFAKPVMTKKRYPVVIHTIDGKNITYPVVGEYHDGNNWVVLQWTIQGKDLLHSTSDLDLINVPEKEIYEFYTNIHLGKKPIGKYYLVNQYKTKDEAIYCAGGSAVFAGVKIQIEIDGDKVSIVGWN